MINLGIQPTDRVLIQLPNWTEFVPVYFALQKIGAIPVMLIDRYRELEILQLADITGATAWVVPVRQHTFSTSPPDLSPHAERGRSNDLQVLLPIG